jgi:hypothetical protein
MLSEMSPREAAPPSLQGLPQKRGSCGDRWMRVLGGRESLSAAGTERTIVDSATNLACAVTTRMPCACRSAAILGIIAARYVETSAWTGPRLTHSRRGPKIRNRAGSSPETMAVASLSPSRSFSPLSVPSAICQEAFDPFRRVARLHPVCSLGVQEQAVRRHVEPLADVAGHPFAEDKAAVPGLGQRRVLGCPWEVPGLQWRVQRTGRNDRPLALEGLCQGQGLRTVRVGAGR